MRTLIGAGLMLLLTTSASAQSLGELLRDPPLYALAQTTAQNYPVGPPTTHQHDDTAMWTFISAASADWSVTTICFELECSPDHAGFTTINNPKKAIGVGGLIDAAFVYFVREWVQPDHPKLAQVFFYGAAALRTGMMTHKVTDLRRNTARTAPPGT